MSRKQLLALFLCGLLCVVLIFSNVLLALKSDHDCTGEHCRICLGIQVSQAILKSLLGSIAVAVLAAIGICLFTKLISLYLTAYQKDTPISLKVKLLN